ncbi:unknown [Ruminococcus sp. CAG:579]|nr:unknown [Ruminococcus sp. CAG:579]
MIKPWTWEESNGSVAYWQMKAAVEVLSNCGTTAGFFHPVWNDLVDKVSEVANALRYGWCNAPMKVDELKIAETYHPLTARMFNTLVYNTHYPVWSWQETLGRTEFHGVETHGEAGADIVYGRYFYELTERLNLVIAILNDTADSIKLRLAYKMLSDISAEMAALETTHLRTHEKHKLTAIGVLTQEKLDTWRFHYNIPTAEFTAIIQNGDFAECRGQIESYLNIKRKVNVLPVSTLSVKPHSADVLGTYAEIIDVKPQTFCAENVETAQNFSKLNRLHSVTFDSNNFAKLGIKATARTSKTQSVKWSPLSTMLTFGAKASMDKLNFIGAAHWDSAHKGYSKLDMRKSGQVSVDFSDKITVFAVLEQADLFIGFSADTKHKIANSADISYNISENVSAESKFGLSIKADAGVIRYAKANTESFIVLNDFANLETTGSWSYPVQEGENLSISQVYEIEQNDEHLFFDFGVMVGRTAFEISSYANIDWQLKWEYPVQSGNILFIPQSVLARQFTSKLEVD